MKACTVLCGKLANRNVPRPSLLGPGLGVGGEQGSLTVIRLVGGPAVPGVLMEVVGVALGTLLGAEVLVRPRALLAVADLVLEHGP